MRMNSLQWRIERRTEEFEFLKVSIWAVLQKAAVCKQAWDMYGDKDEYCIYCHKLLGIWRTGNCL